MTRGRLAALKTRVGHIESTRSKRSSQQKLEIMAAFVALVMYESIWASVRIQSMMALALISGGLEAMPRIMEIPEGQWSRVQQNINNFKFSKNTFFK